MSNAKEKLGALIKGARKEMGIKQKELATKLGISARHMMAIENNQQNPSFGLLCRLLQEVHINTNPIFHSEAAHDRRNYERAAIMLSKCNDNDLDTIISVLESLERSK